MPVFFVPDDYRIYLSIVREQAEKHHVSFWAYCLMPNHVHFIAVPEQEDSLALMFREGHRQYTRYINKREDWTGHLWQDRYASFVMDEAHCLMAARYIENNPVESRIVSQAEDYQWSSARAHTGLKKDVLIQASFMDERVRDWKSFLTQPYDTQREAEMILEHLRTGKPLVKKGTE